MTFCCIEGQINGLLKFQVSAFDLQYSNRQQEEQNNQFTLPQSTIEKIDFTKLLPNHFKMLGI